MTNDPTPCQPGSHDVWATTRQRAAVLGLLADVRRFRSAQEMFHHLRMGGTGVGLTTVYRTLALLATEGRVDAVRADTGEVLYRLCSTAHHHHLVCRRCGMAVELDTSDVERWATHVARDHEYSEITHTIGVVGICPRCAP